MDELKAKLAIQEKELKQKNEAADALIQIVGVETEKVSTEKTIGKTVGITSDFNDRIRLIMYSKNEIPVLGSSYLFWE